MPLSWNLGTLTSWNPLDHSRPVTGLLYLCCIWWSLINKTESSIICIYEGCPESIRPFWIYREPVVWPWCNLAASQRRPYFASMSSHSPVGLVSWQWNAVDWACVLCDCHIHNDWASISASSRQYACPFYSSRAGFLFWGGGKASHHPSLSAPIQPGFGSLRLLTFPKAKLAVEREEMCGGIPEYWVMACLKAHA